MGLNGLGLRRNSPRTTCFLLLFCWSAWQPLRGRLETPPRWTEAQPMAGLGGAAGGDADASTRRGNAGRSRPVRVAPGAAVARQAASPGDVKRRHPSCIRSFDLSSEEAGYLHRRPDNMFAGVSAFLGQLEADASAGVPFACRPVLSRFSIPRCHTIERACADRVSEAQSVAGEHVGAESVPGAGTAGRGCDATLTTLVCEDGVLRRDQLDPLGHAPAVSAVHPTCLEVEPARREADAALAAAQGRPDDLAPPRPRSGTVRIGPFRILGNPAAQVGPRWLDLTRYGVVAVVARRHTDLLLPLEQDLIVGAQTDICDGLRQIVEAALADRVALDLKCSVSNVIQTNGSRRLKRPTMVLRGMTMAEGLALLASEVSEAEFGLHLQPRAWWLNDGMRLVRVHRWTIRQVGP